MARKIKTASISEMPLKITDPPPWVTVDYEDGTAEKLFSFYPDEISFSPSEFVGLTREESFQLVYRKDKAFLQAPR